MGEATDARTPPWASRAVRQVRATRELGQELVGAAVYFGELLGILALVIGACWLLIGLITGYLPMNTLVGSGGIAGLVVGLVTAAISWSNRHTQT